MRTVASALLASGLAVAQECAVGTDHPYGDMPGMPLQMPVNDTAACQAACEVEPQCSVYAFIAPGCVGNVAPLCYLKSTDAGAKPATPCHCSGFPQRANPAQPVNTILYNIDAMGVSAILGTYGLAGFTTTPTRPIPGAPASITHNVALDGWSMVLGNQLINSTQLGVPVPILQTSDNSVEYFYSKVHDLCNVTMMYKAMAERGAVGFVGHLRKTLTVTCEQPIDVTSVSPWDTLRLQPTKAGAVLEAVTYPSGAMGGYGAFARLSDDTGVFVSAENPFLYSLAASGDFNGTNNVLLHVGFHPFQHWNASITTRGRATYTYDADAGLLAAYPLRLTPVPQPGEVARSSLAAGETILTVPPAQTTGATSPARPALTLRTVVTVPSPAGRWASESHLGTAATLDVAERDAFRGVAESLMLLAPPRPNTAHIPWTENDYQIDVSNATRFQEYQRILERLGSLGIRHILYAGSNSAVSVKANNTDAWGWEQTLWLNEGQHIRMQLWTPGAAPLPPSLSALVSAAAAANVSLMPYIYPVLAFQHDPSWLYTYNQGEQRARLSSSALHDYLVGTLVNLSNALPSGLGGAGFDYTFTTEPDTTQYAQWYGWRRILRDVRLGLQRDVGHFPVVDNRQANHEWSPYMWTAGSYAEPLQSDEGPYSWPAYVLDPKTDRQSANRQREISYLYAQSMFCPPSAMPGFMQHQTDRFNGSSGGIPENTDFLARDFDFYGAAYSVLSSIATGPANNVVCGLPARDQGEFEAFPATSNASNGIDVSVGYYRQWFSWVEDNFDVMKNVKPLPVPPAPGVTDGTFAMDGTGGFVFLFNPNALAMPSPPLSLDASLDLLCAPGSSTYVLTELYPVPGRVLTTAPCGAANLTVMMEGRSALVISVQPANTSASQPALVVGRAARGSPSVSVSVGRDGAPVLHLPEGSWADVHWRTNPQFAGCAIAPLYVLLPEASSALKEGAAVSVELGARGKQVRARVSAPGAQASSLVSSCPPGTPPAPAALPGFVTIPVWFSAPASATFIHSSPVDGMGPLPSFSGGALNGTVSVPAALFDQLAARNASYPVPFTSYDATVAWLVPGRLIAYVDVGKALGPGLAIPATLDGRAVPVQPVWSCRSLLRADCFSGYWIDLTAAGVQPGTPAALTLTLPPIPAGSFAGVFYDNGNTIASAEVEDAWSRAA